MYQRVEQPDEQQDEEDQRDQEFLDEFDNEQTTLELSNLYTSCLEWILNRPVSSLNSQLMIDDYDKIQYPAALELLMNLVGQSNNLLRQRALLDFYMLSQWDTHNGHILLFHQKFHTWLLDLLLPYQQYIDEQDENCRAVYDMGCKLHTLLLTNSCLNPEEEAFKKLNMISRYPLTVPQEKKVTAEKLSRVLLIHLVLSLKNNLDNNDVVDSKLHDSQMAAWRNLIHIIQLSEEMMYTSNSVVQKEIQTYNDEKRNINLNLSLLDWQKSQGYLLYFERCQDNAPEYQWAEQELIETIFESLQGLYKKIGTFFEDVNSKKLLSQQQYQVSNQIIQERVYETLERVYQSGKFEQDIQLLMRECLVGSQITPRGLDQSSSQLNQNLGSESISTTSSKFSFPLTGQRLKNIKLQLGGQNPQATQKQINQKQNQHCFIDSIINMLCTALIEGSNKEVIHQWLQQFEIFMRYIMIISETLDTNGDKLHYQRVQQKFSNVITFAFAFLFHQIHSTNIQQKQSPQSKPPKLQIHVAPNSNTSRSSSPKDYQAINRIYALTLKNLVIYYVNIVDYKDLCKSHPSQECDFSAIQAIFSSILVNKYSNHQQSQLITMDDIKRYKATNFEDFPEYFSHEDWRVTFFHNEEINEILRAQMSQKLIDEVFLTRRQTYGKGISEMNTRSEKTKQDIQKRIHSDTFEKVSKMSEMAYHQKIESKLQIFVQNVYQKQQFNSLSSTLYVNKGLWQNFGPKYLKASNQGFCGSGVKGFLKERSGNGFKFIDNEGLEHKLFKFIDPDLSKKISPQQLQDPSTILFQYFGQNIDLSLIKENKSSYIDHVKELFNHSGESREILQCDCVLLKAFYQTKGTILMTSEELVFIYIDEEKLENENNFDVKNQDNLFFFKKGKRNQKVYKKIDLEGIKDIQRRRFIGFKNCLEIFMVENHSHLFKFNSTEARDNFAKKLLKMRGLKCRNLRFYDSLDPRKIIKKRELTDRWRQWRISNFHYLMMLNYYGGRSQNDLSQYPVFPWVFSNYSQLDSLKKPDYLTINKFYQRGDAPPDIFRDLSKNMQLLGTAERQAEFKKKYEDIDGFSDIDDRFHCGSHYSNPGIVLHYLSRVSPFTDALVELQGMNHDNPDRIFHSLQESFLNALRDHSDVREIIPEFFYLPELYLNNNNVEFGRRHGDHQTVDHIHLPQWTQQNPYKFVAALREALESNYVSQSISKWIDYFFGYKQQGPDAERCLNTYSSVTYEDRIDLEKLCESDPHLAESYKLQMYNYGQTPSNILQFRTKEHPPKKYREEIFKYNLVSDQFVNLKVYRPVNKKKNNIENNKAAVLMQIEQGKIPLIQPKAIIKAQFINEGLIAAARLDGKMRFYMWVNQANDLNPLTPFTCGKEKKKLYEYCQNSQILHNDLTNIQLNKPLLILNRGKIVISGGHWDGQICVSYTQEIQQDKAQGIAGFNRNAQQPQQQLINAKIDAHQSCCSVIASTIEDPNKIISKNQQNNSSASIQNDICTVITGSKQGDIIIWKFSPESNIAPNKILQQQKHFFDHDDEVTSIFIHQEMQYFATSSNDGTANLYSLSKMEILRCFKHPNMTQISTVVLSNAPLPCLAMFSPHDKIWQSFSINGQNLNALEDTQSDPQIIKKNYYEECSKIVAPKVIQNSYFMERLIYGTEKGYMVIRELPFMTPLKRINISTNNIIQPVISFIVSKDRRFLLVGCGEGGLTVITEPFSANQQAQQLQQRQVLQVSNHGGGGQSHPSSQQNTGQSSGGVNSAFMQTGSSQITNSNINQSRVSQPFTSRTDAQNISMISGFTSQAAPRANEQSGSIRNIGNMTQGGFNLDSSPSSKPTDESNTIDQSISPNVTKAQQKSIEKLNQKYAKSQTKVNNQIVKNNYYGEIYGERSKSPSGATEALKQKLAQQNIRISSSGSGKRQNSNGKQGSQQRGGESKNATITIGSNTIGGFTTTLKVSEQNPYDVVPKTAFLIPNEKGSSSSSQRAVISKSQQSQYGQAESNSQKSYSHQSGYSMNNSTQKSFVKK